ncbi:hypothetical protein BDK51DRAFT_47866 [Blyttiomyces helicus]|uniref:DDE Tnp4 domain-containing protein n=1 Tax=Blyttiomyces helicus TaxID=388810 RepID=A0A4P9W6D3_9FUNG|nr:hypothetical protein BDK51DRAFT_47866 [Blyttiomyces helicus]|eukprot:RKO87542.1 hypothetical protein BDK51DRAFT_47866 [Blyttiomyces helicus]
MSSKTFAPSPLALSPPSLALRLNMCYSDHRCQRRFKRKNQEVQPAQVVNCAATLLQLSTILFQTYLRDRHYLTTSCLVKPLCSFWHSLYAHGTNSNLTSVIGFNRGTFDDLLKAFLVFTSTMVEHKTLCEMFGVPHSTLHQVLTNAEIALQSFLKILPDAEIRWPSFAQQQRWARLTHDKKPLPEGRWVFIDGKNYRVKAPTNA